MGGSCRLPHWARLLAALLAVGCVVTLSSGAGPPSAWMGAIHEPGARALYLPEAQWESFSQLQVAWFFPCLAQLTAELMLLAGLSWLLAPSEVCGAARAASARSCRRRAPPQASPLISFDLSGKGV